MGTTTATTKTVRHFEIVLKLNERT